MYIPKPINTDNIVLDSKLAELIEKIAENVHNVWAENRIKEGWTYGEKRDDVNRTNPCLVPYCELPESEKEYDRSTASSTLKLITALGYDIVRNTSQNINNTLGDK